MTDNRPTCGRIRLSNKGEKLVGDKWNDRVGGRKFRKSGLLLSS